MNINAETRLTSFFSVFDGYVQKISKINIGRENRKMENIVLSCYLVDFGTEIFGSCSLRSHEIFGGDFWGVFARDFCQPIRDFWWGFLVSCSLRSQEFLVGVFGCWEFLGIPIQ